MVDKTSTSSVEGLETLSVEMLRDYAFMKADPDGDYVTRSQAEAIIVALQSDVAGSSSIIEHLTQRAEKAEADNAAKDAEIKHLKDDLLTHLWRNRL